MTNERKSLIPERPTTLEAREVVVEVLGVPLHCYRLSNGQVVTDVEGLGDLLEIITLGVIETAAEGDRAHARATAPVLRES